MTTAVVTGAGGALGRAIALRLAGDGRAVALTDIDGVSLGETYRQVVATGAHATSAVLDLADTPAIEKFFDEVRHDFGPVEILVNNAAIYPATPFLDVDLAEYDRVHAINQRAYWYCCQQAASQMAEIGSGAIVNVASITMHGGWDKLAAYVATKGAAVSLTRALARELGPSGIRVNAVSPGAFPTAAEKIHDDPEAYSAQVIERQAIKRRGAACELAAVVSFLTGADSSFVTGQTLEVNGGWVMT